MIALMVSAPPEELNEAQLLHDAAEAKLAEALKIRADCDLRDVTLKQRHDLLVAMHKRLQAYEAQLQAREEKAA